MRLAAAVLVILSAGWGAYSGIRHANRPAPPPPTVLLFMGVADAGPLTATDLKPGAAVPPCRECSDPMPLGPVTP